MKGRMQYEENYSSAADIVEISLEGGPVNPTTDSSILNRNSQLSVSKRD